MVEYALTMGFVKIIFVDHEPHYLFVVEAKYGFAGHTSFCALKKLKNNPLPPPLPKKGEERGECLLIIFFLGYIDVQPLCCLSWLVRRIS